MREKLISGQLHMVIGGSGSGKSAYAETLAVSLWEGLQRGGGEASRLYYVATMQVTDAESRSRVLRHQNLRAGKGFTTVEQPYALEQLLDLPLGKEDVLLLEDLSNLLANERYREEGRLYGISPKECDKAYLQWIVKPLKALCEQVGAVVVVTNAICSDGVFYAEETLCYMWLLASLNRVLATGADTLTEVICGIPVERIC